MLRVAGRRLFSVSQRSTNATSFALSRDHTLSDGGGDSSSSATRSPDLSRFGSYHLVRGYCSDESLLLPPLFLYQWVDSIFMYSLLMVSHLGFSSQGNEVGFGSEPATVEAVKTPNSKIVYDDHNHERYPPGDPSKRAFAYFVLSGGRFVYASVLRLLVLKLIVSMSASKDVLALASLEVDLGSIEPGTTVTVKWRGKPVFIRRRTEDDIKLANSVDLGSLRDPQEDAVRVKNPEWLVVVGVCTHLGCIPLPNAGDYGGCVRCSASGENGSTAKRTTLHDLYEKEGQSPWYDNLCRPVTDLLPFIARGVRGVTSNPAIFQKAISTSDAYNDQFRTLVESGTAIKKAYWELVVKDIQDACKLFEPIYDQTEAEDGYVSVEVSPLLADDTKTTIKAAKLLHKSVNRRNVYIKIPATAPCIPSIRDVIASGISVNVTLIFSIARYEAVIDAYLDGLEASGLDDLSRVTSVASFFVSRVDTLMDKMLEKIGTPEALDLRGKLSYTFVV
ncbi:hypothetical protein DY000_02000527 [Brassica cretica]|uniref:quinol--cytochrome-c reductase n=1 Tax=Brassica cretica TaxID=69181 RepID=A0ABQ7C358_BRACR|nr:hypothetical protein DY000_02000527 [Brassica cretica]